MNFKIGDIIECVDANGAADLFVGGRYQVVQFHAALRHPAAFTNNLVCLRGMPTSPWMRATRFKLVEQEPYVRTPQQEIDLDIMRSRGEIA